MSMHKFGGIVEIFFCAILVTFATLTFMGKMEFSKFEIGFLISIIAIQCFCSAVKKLIGDD